MSRDLMLRGGLLAGTGAVAGLLVGAVGHEAGQPVSAWFLEALLLAVVFILAGALVFLRPTRTLAEVARAADRFAAGEFDVRAPGATGPGEELTHSFNTMARRVQELLGAVAAEHSRLEAVFEAATDALIALTNETTVEFLNPAAERIFHTTAERALHRPLIETVRDYELDALARRAIAGTPSAETIVISLGPERMPVRAVAVPIRNGGTWAVLLLLADLTEVTRIDQVRRDFLGNVSHELRTPLASISALVETLESGAVEPGAETEEFLRRIRQQVDGMTELVNEFLDLSRIESGALELRPEPIDLTALVQEAVGLLRTRAERLEVTIQPPESEGPVVEGDHMALLRVVSNLLDNAIKFSPCGGTVVIATRDEGELGAISVHDDGPGMAEHEVGRVFERFYKGDAARSGGGSGLGLAIVKHIVRVHGGTATVESSPGKGATFTVRLPKKFVGVTRALVPGRAPGIIR
ncbi:MAG: ATP-binding protein [Hyphomicrobiales bacterium]